MKLLKLVMQGIPHFKDTMEIDFVAQQRVADDDKEKLDNVFTNFYSNKTISFIGINASGKTRTLKAISFVMNMLNNVPLNSIKTKDVFMDLGDGKQITITAYFYKDSCVKKLETIIKKENDPANGEAKLMIDDETLWSKNAEKIKTKKSIFDFTDKDFVGRRNKNEQYLLNDVSIIIAENSKNDGTQSGVPVIDTLDFTGHNLLTIGGNIPGTILRFLDPSIEYLICGSEGNKNDIRLKFCGSDEIVLNNPNLLQNYLSSGTIKGLNIFSSAAFVFGAGGYLVVDEIENHFNKEIVATLMRFFMDADVNNGAATLIFSTHYSELLDEFDRNDCIYIVKNVGGIGAENLSTILKRNDLKKSEVYDSGYLENTAPEYDSYFALKKFLAGMHREE